MTPAIEVRYSTLGLCAGLIIFRIGTIFPFAHTAAPYDKLRLRKSPHTACLV